MPQGFDNFGYLLVVTSERIFFIAILLKKIDTEVIVAKDILRATMCQEHKRLKCVCVYKSPWGLIISLYRGGFAILIKIA